jgi:hypothetical protein
MLDLAQFGVFLARGGSSDRLNEFHLRGQQAFAQNALAYHPVVPKISTLMSELDFRKMPWVRWFCN